MDQINKTINEFMIPNKIIRSKRKTISITINEDAELVVRAPKKLSIEKIQDFIY